MTPREFAAAHDRYLSLPDNESDDDGDPDHQYDDHRLSRWEDREMETLRLRQECDE